jgi:uncharacterized protein with NAD-binding domain and iron-sulfur cluster
MPKKRVVILGGGMAAMSAAFELTRTQKQRDEIEVSIYTLGWRLGGKGASGRNPHQHQRIEEHGLHIWFGFYENAFRQMIACLEEYNEIRAAEGKRLLRCSVAHEQGAEDRFAVFQTQSVIATTELVDGQWIPWLQQMPTDATLPGVGQPYPKPSDSIHKLFEAMKSACESAATTLAREPMQTAAEDCPRDELFRDHLQNVLRAGALEEVSMAGIPVVKLLQVAQELVDRIHGKFDDQDSLDDALDQLATKLLSCIEMILQVIRRRLENRIDEKPIARRALLMVDFIGTTIRGLLADNVLTRGFEQLELADVDLSKWLKLHGALDETLQSQTLRGAYDTVFGFRRGEYKEPFQAKLGRDPDETLSVGVGLRSGLRMFALYKGAFMWKMRAGMGDSIFAPFYKVLSRRGVRFQFFHRVERLRLSADNQSLAVIEMRRQAVVKGDREYAPLIEVNDLECWPSEPLYDQLEEGEELLRRRSLGDFVNLESSWTAWRDYEERNPIVLKRGQDFDQIILAIPIACLPDICGDILNCDARPDLRDPWVNMVTKVETMRTMAVQFWFSESSTDLGWDNLNYTEDPMVGGFVRPLSTWADMSHLIDREAFPLDQKPRSIAYLCGPMPDSVDEGDVRREPPPKGGPGTEFRRFEAPYFSDPDFPARQADIVRSTAREFLEQHAKWLWPKLAIQSGLVGTFEEQWFRANIDPSERYVLSIPGTSQYRLRADGSAVDGLILAGDWIRNGLDAGCIEAAVMSGMQASRTICGEPKTVVAEHFGEPPP